MEDERELLGLITCQGDKSEKETSVEDLKESAEYALKMAQVGKANEELEGLKQDREQRKAFAGWLFLFTCVYVVSVLTIVILSGRNLLAISDSVQITMLSSTLAEVIGVFAFVAKYLFHT